MRGLMALLAILAIWFPEYWHYHVRRGDPDPGVVRQLDRIPAANVLAEIGHYAVGIRFRLPRGSVDGAEQILQGSLASADFPTLRIAPDAYPADMRQGDSTLQLVIASFGIEQVLLDAYAQTGKSAYLDLVTRRLHRFAEYERARRLGDGFLWNDHAVAARIGVLAQWWRFYRQSPHADADTRRSLIALVERSGQLLAKPAHFTAATNHGVMQNLALLEIAAAFPALPEAPAWKRLALQRLQLQLPYYVSDEGFVLEHSADYQFVGVELLAQTARVLQLLGEPVPAPLALRLARSQDVLSLMLRPDGSLPLAGNTAIGTWPGTPRSSASGVVAYTPPAAHPGATLLAPLSGFSLWWSADATAQTFVAWSRFAGHGHKHADEPSVHWWRSGINWITASGYWPYDAAGFAEANGWPGANAPHLVDEPANSPRNAKALYAADIGDLHLLDLRRAGPGSLDIRRQILQASPTTLIVLDFAHGAPGQTLHTIWTTDPRAALELTAPGQAVVTLGGSGQAMRIGYAGVMPDAVRALRGSLHPFAGWIVKERKVIPTDAMLVASSADNSALAYSFSIVPRDGGALPPAIPPRLATDARADAWALDADVDGQRWHFSRHGETLEVIPAGHAAQTIPLRAVADRASDKAALDEDFRAVTQRFPKWKEFDSYRVRLSELMVALALTLEIGLLLAFCLVRRALSVTLRRGLNIVVALGWIGVVAWAHLVYFR